MAVIETNPFDIAMDAQRLRAGDEIVLEGGEYRSPVFIDGIGGTAVNPVLIRAAGDAVFCGDETFGAARMRINRLVKRRQAAGYYPSIGQTADEAWLVLRNCRYVIVEGLRFEGCWPGAIYIDQSQHVTLRDVHILQGTIAIGVNGGSSRDILVEGCTWQQDISPDHDLWKRIPWTAVHGHSNNARDSGVDIDADYRLYDGDFFRAWEVPGNITIRNNRVSDAFNGIHFFNRRTFKPHLDDTGRPIAGKPNGAANVLIEHNTFHRIRDNIIEPEKGAWNWVVRHNAFLDFYRLFSLEMQFGGYFYIYGNVGWQRNMPGPHNIDGKRNDGSLVKLGKETVGAGPFYFFNNSWELMARIVSKYSIREFYHFNNLVAFNGGQPSQKNLFGSRSTIEEEAAMLPHPDGPPSHEERAYFDPKRFTTRWESLKIQSDGDVIDHVDFPGLFGTVGMAFGNSSRGENPAFHGGADVCTAFKSNAEFSSVSLDLQLPFGSSMKLDAGQQCGAVQPNDRLFDVPREFGWIDSATAIGNIHCPGCNPLLKGAGFKLMLI